jgi:poly(3-hydroxybutyrate) depolymerase
VRRLLALLLGLLASLPVLAEPLPALRAQKQGITASGLSAGGFMAVQLHVAHSASVSGAAAIAGGPYYCAQGSLWSALYNCLTPSAWAPVPAAASLKALTETFAAAGWIDATRNLAGAPVWLFSGAQDRTVAPAVVNELRRYYELYGARVVLVSNRLAGHGMPVEKAASACGESAAPFLNDCDYDAAGELLRHLLGPLKSPAKERPLREFDQGFVYVPGSCEKERCRVHVAFHGCRQSVERFARDAGYNRWAESNRLIVLYPQVEATWYPFNPRGCWDWWGYSGANYATREGAQIRAVRAMLERLAQ